MKTYHVSSHVLKKNAKTSLDEMAPKLIVPEPIHTEETSKFGTKNIFLVFLSILLGLGLIAAITTASYFIFFKETDDVFTNNGSVKITC